MTHEGKSKAPDALQQTFQSRHPELGSEIEGAIRTLRKVQQITGTIVPAGDTAPSGMMGVKPPVAEGAGVSLPPRSGTSGEVPILLKASESFGRYQIVRLLGKGAMGAVYLAYDGQLQRYVALKTPFLGDNPDTISRFFREARATAQLRSPYLCPIYDVDQISGIYYLTMAFIEGQPLEQVIKEGGLNDQAAMIELVTKVARGLEKAHKQGIIHRDLKPDNIMIDSEGEPIVMDFGLARRVDDENQITTPGRIIGTPAYMSPEQVEGDPTKIGPATDIYSLGVILYRFIAGRLPFHGSLLTLLRKIGNEEPQKPSAVNTAVTVNSNLERICLKMMAKSPAERFSSMTDVIEALVPFLPQTVTPVERPSIWKRMWSYLCRLFAFRGRSENPAAGEIRSEQASADSGQASSSAQSDVQNGAGKIAVPSSSPDLPNNNQADSQTIDLPSADESRAALQKAAPAPAETESASKQDVVPAELQTANPAAENVCEPDNIPAESNTVDLAPDDAGIQDANSGDTNTVDVASENVSDEFDRADDSHTDDASPDDACIQDDVSGDTNTVDVSPRDS